MNDCMHLDCTPDEKQMVVDFLGYYMPEDSAWGVRKAMWLESEIASVADLLGGGFEPLTEQSGPATKRKEPERLSVCWKSTVQNL